MVNGADKVRELAAQLNTVHLANMQLLEQLSATQAANIQLAAERDKANTDVSDLLNNYTTRANTLRCA
jgi:hypothetical protein